MSGDNLIVGAPFVDLPGTNDAGAAFIFARNQNGTNQWGLVKKLTLTNAVASDHFGSSVAIDANAVVIGVPQADGSGGNAYGAAYLYLQNQGGNNAWGLVDKFLPAAVGVSDNFGCSVAIYQNTIVVGAYNGLNAGQRYGTAFMFRIFYDNPPQLLLPLADQFVTVGVPFAFAVPAGAFADADLADVISYSLAANPAVPAWLNFDPVTGNFSGTATLPGYYPINLVATDIYGLTRTNAFTITAISGVNFNLLAMTSQMVGPHKVIGIQFTGVPNNTYRLQQATNLMIPNWTDVGTQAADGSGVISISITNPPDPACFYRMVYP